jgi:DNA helicase HerA-like ATPase
MSAIEIGRVLESSPSSILIEVKDDKVFDENKKELQIGKYLEISDGNLNKVVATILNIKSSMTDLSSSLKFILQTQPIGYIENNIFIRGTSLIPSPTEPVFVMESSTLSLIYSSNKDYNFPFGRLVQNKSVELKIDANKFFSKHIALVGSTGSGKSCTVSKILQDVIGINQGKNSNSSNQKNSHILIFDIHSEYKSAFDLHKDEKFTLNILDVDSLKLPYWLMNSEELETIFIEGNENNHHNQVSQFKRAVILNKEKHNTSLKDKVTYDTPVYFSIEEVYNYIWNLNNEVVSKLANENCPKLSDGQLITDIEKSVYFNDKLDFVVNSTAAATKASNGAFYGEFNRFLSRLETKLSDNRLSFIIRPLKDDSSKFETKDFGDILKQFLGYIDKANISIIDLSGIPFEVLSITVSLVSRLVFDFAFHYSKLKHSIDEKNDVPFLIVCEEAHNYIPRTGGAEYKASRKSLERIAKEGRKYGLSLMVVSQRPSEVSETIFSQCNNFISLRLTNVNDQNYVKALMPENSNAIADILPNLGPGECLIVGDATIIPSVVKLDMPNPEPKSQSIRFQDEWQKDWKDASFENVIKRWKKE